MGACRDVTPTNQPDALIPGTHRMTCKRGEFRQLLASDGCLDQANCLPVAGLRTHPRPKAEESSFLRRFNQIVRFVRNDMMGITGFPTEICDEAQNFAGKGALC